MKRLSNLLINEFTIVLLTVALLIGAAMCSPCDAATLPYYNIGGYSTSLYIVNPSSEAITAPIGGFPLTVAANGVFRLDGWPKAGGNVADVTLPSGVTAFIELTDPQGSSVRLPAVSGYDKAQVLGLTTDKNQMAQVFIASTGFVSVSFYKDGELLSKYEPNMNGGVAIETAPTGANRAVVESINFAFGDYKQGPVYLFGFHRQVTGGYKIQNPVVATEAK